MGTSLINLLRLDGKVALVTGGCQNFGAEIADGLAEMGATVVLSSRTEDKAVEAANALARTHGVKALGIALDLQSEQSVVEAFNRIVETFGQIDILVNNAGGHQGQKPTGNVEDESLAAFEGFLKVNLTGTFLCLREFSRHAKEHGGAVVNIASVSSMIGRDRSVYAGTQMTPNPVPYTAAKAGVIGLTYDAAACLGKYGIRVNAVSPGGFERGQPAPFVKAYSSHTMLNRMGRDGYDLKGAVAFLCSDAAAYITGHNLYVDGGMNRFR